ncbi:MAG TPA: DUF3108 domain-containing protein [Deltaproteobacteria bacterium]|nr:DUF3108 domain-containing protein [Deltaproteobacteria bacterium]
MRGKTKRSHILIFSALIAILSVLSSVSHGAVEPWAGRRAFHKLPDSGFRPRLGTYHYSFKFNGLNIGTGQVVLDQKGDLFEIRFSARTSPTIDRFYKVRFSGGNITRADSLLPVRTRILSRVRSMNRDTAIHFRDDGTITSVRTESEKGEPLENKVKEIEASDFTMDPLSVVHLIREIDWKPGMEQHVQIFSGRSRYESHFICTGEEVVDIGGQKRKAWEIVQQAIKLDDDGSETEAEKKERDLNIYLSADSARDVLKIDSRRIMGHFLVQLEGFEPAAAGSAGQG